MAAYLSPQATSSEVHLTDRLPEALALRPGEVKLPLTGLSLARTSSNGAGTPGSPAPELVQSGQVGEGFRVAEGHVDDAVVSEGAHGSQRGRLLASSHRGGGEEEAGVLAPVAAARPVLACRVPECLPLGREVAVTGGDAEEESLS